MRFDVDYACPYDIPHYTIVFTIITFFTRQILFRNHTNIQAFFNCNLKIYLISSR